MGTQEVVFVFLLALNIIFQAGSSSTTFTFTNNCPYTVWPAALTGAGKPQLASTGFELVNKASLSLDAPTGWSGRFWGRTGCIYKGNYFTCATGDCGSGQVGCNGGGGALPSTLVEFTLDGGHDGGQDFYDVSLVDGFNLPVLVSPQGRSRSRSRSGSCNSTSCAVNVNSRCPPELSVKGSDGSNIIIACKSACLAFNQPQYCCTGEFQSPDKCKPTSYSMIFKTACPRAYSYAFDDKTSTFTCSTGPNYVITFCP